MESSSRAADGVGNSLASGTWPTQPEVLCDVVLLSLGRVQGPHGAEDFSLLLGDPSLLLESDPQYKIGRREESNGSPDLPVCGSLDPAFEAFVLLRRLV